MNFIVRRVITYLIVLAGVVNIDFFLPRIAPGNATELLISNYVNPSQQQQLVAQRLGLNVSLFVQYGNYLRGIFLSWPPKFGVSYQYFPQSVDSLIAGRIWWTLGLIAASLFLAVAMAYGLAMLSSMRRGGKAEMASTYTSIFLRATPVYWTGLFLIWVFGVSLHWFPQFGKVTPLLSGTDYIGSVIWHGILPVVTLASFLLGENYLILRGSIQEVLKSDYVVSAHVRGLRKSLVARAYVLRNSLLPLVSVLSFSLAGLISGAVLIEAVFGYAGLGDLLVDGIFYYDYPVVEGTLFVLTVIVIIGAIIGDIVLIRLDPRLRR